VPQGVVVGRVSLVNAIGAGRAQMHCCCVATMVKAILGRAVHPDFAVPTQKSTLVLNLVDYFFEFIRSEFPFLRLLSNWQAYLMRIGAASLGKT